MASIPIINLPVLPGGAVNNTYIPVTYNGVTYRMPAFSMPPQILADSSITGNKIIDLNITTAKLADLAVTLAKLAVNSVGESKIIDGAVSNSKLADDAVSTAKMLNAAITAAKLADGSVGTSKLIDNAVTAAKILADAITTSKIVDAAVTTNKLADQSVTAAKLAPSVGLAIPAGIIFPWATGTAPGGYLSCDGAAVSRTGFSTLFGVISTLWGPGDGVSTFNLPNLAGRTLVGAGTYTDPVSGSVTRTFGQSIGAEKHQLTVAELAAHSHFYSVWNSNGAAGGSIEGATPYNRQYQTTNAGGDTPHNNMQPSTVITWIIKT
jgi:microcystin-dependent protein